MYVDGEIGNQDLPISGLAALLLGRTQFYLPNHSEATAKKDNFHFSDQSSPRLPV
jgi:hypothetical protein